MWKKQFVHKTRNKVEIEDKTIQIKDENKGLEIHCDNKKSKMSLPSLDSFYKGTKSHKCPICDYTASRKGHLKQHMESVHDGKKPHKCFICDYSCSRKETLKRHIQAVHEGKKPNQCSICDYSCSGKADLRKHILSVHEGKNCLDVTF